MSSPLDAGLSDNVTLPTLILLINYVLRAVRIRAALLTQTETESERAESNTGVVFGWGACGGVSMDVRIRLRVDKHAGGP